MRSSFFPRDEYFMRLALREAERALAHDDVPIGCVVVHGREVIAAAPNERELRGDPTAHAEVLALREASRALGGWRLNDTVAYVTLEPCAMCVGALLQSDVETLVYAVPNEEDGAAGTVLQLAQHPSLGRRLKIVSGIRRDEADELFATAVPG